MGLPTPEPGLVLNYAYLWRHEYRSGLEEGRKTRPSVIVLCVQESDGETIVTVLPITHAAPVDPNAAVEIPSKVKERLGLDDQRSWVIVDEANEFAWPGYDLRRVPGSERYEFGLLPPNLFNKILAAAIAVNASGRAKLTRRT